MKFPIKDVLLNPSLMSVRPSSGLNDLYHVFFIYFIAKNVYAFWIGYFIKKKEVKMREIRESIRLASDDFGTIWQKKWRKSKFQKSESNLLYYFYRK